MARIRTIKPEFFTSEDILDLSMPARLLYIATWLEADKEGRLAWKPRTLKIRYFPDDDVQIDALCSELIDQGLVVLYGDGLAFIPKFCQHQHINPREAASTLPPPPCLTREARVDDASPRVSDAQGGRKEGREGKEGTTPKPPRGSDELPTGFIEFWEAYPKKVSKPPAIRAWRKLGPDTQTVQAIVAGVNRARRSDQWLRDGGQYIPNPATYLNARRWEDETPGSSDGRPWYARLGYGSAESARADGHREAA